MNQELTVRLFVGLSTKIFLKNNFSQTLALRTIHFERVVCRKPYVSENFLRILKNEFREFLFRFLIRKYRNICARGRFFFFRQISTF